MGAVNTVYGRCETNEQNAVIERHMLFTGTAMTMRDFHRLVIERLLDSHSCADPNCEICNARFSRGRRSGMLCVERSRLREMRSSFLP
jgi:hypothetical protein